jgi:hypothetical protein
MSTHGVISQNIRRFAYLIKRKIHNTNISWLLHNLHMELSFLTKHTTLTEKNPQYKVLASCSTMYTHAFQNISRFAYSKKENPQYKVGGCYTMSTQRKSNPIRPLSLSMCDWHWQCRWSADFTTDNIVACTASAGMGIPLHTMYALGGSGGRRA